MKCALAPPRTSRDGRTFPLLTIYGEWHKVSKGNVKRRPEEKNLRHKRVDRMFGEVASAC